MMCDKIFDSKFSTSNSFAVEIDNNSIKNETMFFNCDLEFAYNKGGPITQSFIDALPQEWQNDEVVFDSRVHMLMPGWCPAIFGWHHDDVPRPDVIPTGQHFMTAGQPDYDNPRYLSEHIVGVVNADICPTQFACGVSKFNAVPEGEVVYKQWHMEVEEKIKSGELTVHSIPDRTLCYFDWQTWHTAIESNGNGWRWFGRLSRNTDRTKRITNEIRVNAQVYLKMPYEGW